MSHASIWHRADRRLSFRLRGDKPLVKETVDRPGEDITTFEPPTGRPWITDVAERRLAQITAALNLHPDDFAAAQAAARRALDGGHDQILSDQYRRITAALGGFENVQLRARAVELFVTLAGDGAPFPSSD